MSKSLVHGSSSLNAESHYLYSPEAQKWISSAFNYAISHAASINEDEASLRLPNAVNYAGGAIAIGVHGQFYDSEEEEEGIHNNSSSSDEEDEENTKHTKLVCSTNDRLRNKELDSNDKNNNNDEKRTPSRPNVTKISSSTVPCVLLPLPVEIERKQRLIVIPTASLKPGRTDWSSKSVCSEYLKVTNQLQHPHLMSDTTTSSIESRKENNKTLVTVILLRSGRFAAAVFLQADCLVHTTSTRYTVRRGQGGAQSLHDTSKGKAKSVGSQLRREGEKALWGDVRTALNQWSTYLRQSVLIYISCPKVMRKHLFEECNGVLDRDDTRIRSVPMSIGRPSYEEVIRVHTTLMTIYVRDITTKEEEDLSTPQNDVVPVSDHVHDNKQQVIEAISTDSIGKEHKPNFLPYSPLHEAAERADVSTLRSMLLLQPLGSEEDEHQPNDHPPSAAAVCDDMDTRAGPKEMTPLHLASSYDGEHIVDAASCILLLLEQGRANPCIVDSHGRPPYFLASNDKLRDAFRLARGTLGEEYCAWDEGAKVGPPLTKDLLQQKKEKALDKKRRQRARQKEQKASERKLLEEQERIQREQEEEQNRAQEAKRVRDGLKARAAENACDFCQTTGTKRSQMFKRLDYVYCSTD
eukprot:CAMPEP_0172420314 /NCGR_PEP_ID=MMETSP1064-20121228/6704_1 /TAXON_ID=202472 /ORGANISM="Aulacoseira subarctica , Strain CCAP 1002/5" /LENGTH=635 /DNA_ID=CAMNT_0013160233 /DNA_START=17 /DNA_END=1924 /DNA_ORIENTATION=-